WSALAFPLRSAWPGARLALHRRSRAARMSEPEDPYGQLTGCPVVLGLLGQWPGGLVLGECRFGVAEDGQRVAGERPGLDVIGPALHLLGDLHPRVVCTPGLGQREGRLAAEERAPGRVDAGQRLAQHDGLGALGRA